MPEPRVRLVPATLPLLHALNDDRARFTELIGSPVPDGWPEFPEAIGFTLAHLQNAPEADHAWSMQFFVDAATGRMVGSGGYVGRPVDRTVEIGYEVAPEFRGRRRGRSRHRAHAARPERVDRRAHLAGLRARRRPGGPGDRHGLGMEMDALVRRVARAGRQPAGRWPRPRAMAERPLILYEASAGVSDPTRFQLAARAQAAGIQLRPRVEVESVESALDLAASGVGDTYVPQVLRPSLPPGLATIGFDPPLVDHFAVIVRSGSRLSRPVQALIDRVADQMRASL